LKAIVIGGTQSGVGKTTVTAGVIGALRARGLRVAVFKTGPDYLDPTFHTAASGQPCRNLDSWIMPPELIVRAFRRAAQRADVAIVEGVMGLFDGRSGEDESGSTAQVAKLLGLPVVLVVDASAMARSAAAMVLGYATFDPGLRVAGVVLNRIAGERHFEAAKVAIERQSGVPVLGLMHRDDAFALPGRHLGLVSALERDASTSLASIAAAAVRGIDIDALLALAAEIPDEAGEEPVTAAEHVPIAIARDPAFSFYYEDGLDELVARGAELLPFSPLTDASLPAGARGVYIGGGYPEVFAAELAANRPMHEALRAHAAAGLPVYAECGGHMYLGQSLTALDGSRYEMAALTPLQSTMQGTRLALGYRVATALREGPVAKAGDQLRGHEFHLSAAAPPSEASACWRFQDPGRLDGFALGPVWSSYLHLHFAASPDAAQRFIDVCKGAWG